MANNFLSKICIYHTAGNFQGLIFVFSFRIYYFKKLVNKAVVITDHKMWPYVHLLYECWHPKK